MRISKTILIVFALNTFFCQSQMIIEKEIKFQFNNYINRESLDLKIQSNDDGSVYGEAIHLLPANFGGHPNLNLPEDVNLNENIIVTDQRELTYPFFTNEVNKEFLRFWLEKIKTIDFGTPIITENYMFTTDGTYGTLYLKIGENEMKIGLRNFEEFDSGNLFLWISDLINHFGIDSNKLFGK